MDIKPATTAVGRGALCALLCAAIGCDAEQEPRPPPRAGDNPAPGGAIADAGDPAPCPENAKRACRVILGEHAGVLSCFAGVEICEGGAWGACGEDVAVDAPEAPGTREARPAGEDVSVPLSLTDAGACDSPCDPGCALFDEQPDGGVAIPPTVVGSYQGGSLSALPGGFQNKLLKDADHPPDKLPCDPADHGACQADHHCVGGLCVPWAPGETDPGCAGVDLTVGATCSGPVVPVCNRGQTTAPAGVRVTVFAGNSSQLQGTLGLCANLGASGASVAGDCVVPAAIPPGQCVPAVCPPGLVSGTKTLAVNLPSPPAGAAPIAECWCGDNWSAYSNGGACSTFTQTSLAPTTYAQSYASSCPAGTKVQWGYLGYAAAVPSNASGASSLTIEAQTSEPPASMPAGCAGCVTVASIPSDPASCPLAGPAPCPADVYAALGLPAARRDLLELVFTLEPTPDGALGPALSSWQLTYSCPASE